MNKHHVTNADVMLLADKAVQQFIAQHTHLSLGSNPPTFPAIYGVPRGGVAAAFAFAHAYTLRVNNARPVLVDNPKDADIIVDDIIDSGNTLARIAATLHAGNPGQLPYFCALFGRPEKKYTVSVEQRFACNVHVAGTSYEWLVFPWEGNELASAEDVPVRLLQFIGEDPSRGGLRETPKRFLKAWQHYTSGYKQDPSAVLKVFEDGAEKCDEMVCVHNIPVYSHCEHHLAPFFGVAHVAYIPDGKIVGLSKLARLVDIFAHRLQVQERLTNQIADALNEHLKPLGVGVVITCRHMCMEARGVQRQGTGTTSAMRGAMRNDASARAEFLALVQAKS